MVPGTLSFFRDVASTPGVAVTSGSAALAITRTAGQSVTPVYPGGPAAQIDSVTAATVTNTGDVPLALSAALAAPGATASNFAGAVVISVQLQTGAVCAATPPGSAWSGAAGDLSSSLATLAPGGVQRICLWQSLPSSAPAGTYNQSAALTLTLTGTQQGS